MKTKILSKNDRSGSGAYLGIKRSVRCQERGCRPPFWACFYATIFDRCCHLGWPRVNLWLVIRGTRVVFLMTNGCATRVQWICKRLQTVLEEGVFCWAVKRIFEKAGRQLQRRWSGRWGYLELPAARERWWCFSEGVRRDLQVRRCFWEERGS